MAVLQETVTVKAESMSLISTTNFLAPLRSKVQIGAILVLGVLVAVVRFASSHGTSPERVRLGDGARSPSQAPAQAYSREESPSVDPEIEAYLASRRRARPPESSGDSEVDGLLRGGAVDRSAKHSGDSQASEPAQPEKLNDIKRSLGL